jgi:signal transduction histidine kinase
LPFARLQAYCIIEILLDLAVLLGIVQITGGTASPLLPFFVFHMAIGTAMLATRTMYVIAAAAWLGALALYGAEVLNILPAHPTGPVLPVRSPAPELNLAALATIVFATVYLTDAVKKRSESYRHIADFVREEGRRKLERALQEISDLESRKSHYMRISAHQLRSPLGTVKTSLQVLTKGYADPASERGSKLIKGAVERVDDLLAIVNDLLDLAKIREGKEKALWTRNVDIGDLVDEVIESLRPLAESGKMQLFLDVKGEAVLQWGVPRDLYFAFESLIQNAIKYSDPGGEVRVAVNANQEEVTLSVADQGIGIPEDLQSDVFLEFIRAPNAKQHASQGTGLGLAIVRASVEQHGGVIALASQEGIGSTFTVRLPKEHSPPVGLLDSLIDEA